MMNTGNVILSYRIVNVSGWAYIDALITVLLVYLRSPYGSESKVT